VINRTMSFPLHSVFIILRVCFLQYCIFMFGPRRQGQVPFLSKPDFIVFTIITCCMSTFVVLRLAKSLAGKNVREIAALLSGM